MRWVRPGQSPIPPSEFITVAEHTGLIAPLTKYVLERAIADCAAWRRDGLELAVAVNLSVRSILDHGLPGEIAWMLSKAGLEPACLELEITESVLMADPGRAQAFLTICSRARRPRNRSGAGYRGRGERSPPSPERGRSGTYPARQGVAVVRFSVVPSL